MTASSASEAVNVAEWRAAMSGVTPGPWYSESVDTEGSYGSGEDTTEGFKSYVVRTEAQKSYGDDAVVCDALNSGTAEVHEEFDEDGTHAWDEPGRCNMAWVARCSTENVGSLLSEIERLRAEVERLKGLVAGIRECPQEPWQDIATAPKDGTFALTCIGDSPWLPAISHWGSYEGVTRWGADPETFMEEDHFMNYWTDCQYEPTHWQPLPVPFEGSGRTLADANSHSSLRKGAEVVAWRYRFIRSGVPAPWMVTTCVEDTMGIDVESEPLFSAALVSGSREDGA